MRKSIFLFCTTALAAVATPVLAQDAQTSPQDRPDDLDADETQPDDGVIVVTGLRQSLETSQEIKRNSEQILDVVVAEDIGKLPDLTAPESLARITGVQVDRAAGEAADVRVRGLPNLSTTYNGREIFTSLGRNVALQDFPAGSISRLEVYKSSTANLIEGGIAGQINVRGRRPFDFDGLRISGGINVLHLEEADEQTWNGNLLLSNRWDVGDGELGLLLNVSQANFEFQDSTREQAFFVATANPGQTDTPGFFFPDNQAIFYGIGDRERPAVNAALQWRPSPEFEFYVDGLYQGFNAFDQNVYRESRLFGGGLQFTDVVLQEDGLRAESLTATGGAPSFGFQGSLMSETDTYQLGSGMILDASDRLRLSFDVAYTFSSFDQEQLNIDSFTTVAPDRTVFFDAPTGDGGPAFTWQDFDALDPSNYIFAGLFDRRLAEEGDDIQARFDVQYEADLGFIERIDLGVRANDRNASRQSGARFAGQRFRGLNLTEIPVDLYDVPPGFSFDELQGLTTFVQPDPQSIWDNRDVLREFVGFDQGAAPFDDVEAFQANEKTLGGYAQLKYAFDVGFPIDGLIGVRVVQTDSEITGTSRENLGGGVVNFVPVTASNEYTDVLPNFSMRLEFTPELQARLAYTETRTKPNFGQLNPSTTFNPPTGACQTDPTSEECFRTGGSGNPDLDPIESQNYDVTLGYYFARRGSATVSLFRRDVTGFISNVTVTEPDPEFNEFRRNLPVNSEDGQLQGVEVAFAATLDAFGVGNWLSGFGLGANYTYIDAEVELPEFLAETLPGPQPFPNVSEHAYNVVGFYEQEAFSARLAYNYRSDNVLQYQRIPGGDDARPLIEEGRGQLDFSATVSPIDNLTLAFNVSNILAEPFEITRTFGPDDLTFPRNRRYIERIFSLGLRFRL